MINSDYSGAMKHTKARKRRSLHKWRNAHMHTVVFEWQGNGAMASSCVKVHTMPSTTTINDEHAHIHIRTLTYTHTHTCWWTAETKAIDKVQHKCACDVLATTMMLKAHTYTLAGTHTIIHTHPLCGKLYVKAPDNYGTLELAITNNDSVNNTL